MSEGDKDKLKKQFIESGDEDSVLDAFLNLLPSDDECYKRANADEPPKFVKKLRDIRSSERVIMGAVADYAGAKLMRMRCEKRRFPRMRLVQLDKNLLGAYDSINDTLETGRLEEEKEAARGRKLLDGCVARAENIKVKDLTIDATVAKGELHCIANGEGYEDREISWKRE